MTCDPIERPRHIAGSSPGDNFEVAGWSYFLGYPDYGPGTLWNTYQIRPINVLVLG